MSYIERDAIRIIPLKSDDGGLTWYPVGGSASSAREERDAMRVIRMVSADAGVTWTTT